VSRNIERRGRRNSLPAKRATHCPICDEVLDPERLALTVRRLIGSQEALYIQKHLERAHQITGLWLTQTAISKALRSRALSLERFVVMHARTMPFATTAARCVSS